MTSAAELFYNRRSRPARLSNPRHQDRDADTRHHPRSRRCAERQGWCENGPAEPVPIRSKNTFHHRSHSVRERELLSSISGTENGNPDGICTSRIDRLSLIRNKQLPSSVLQARERLLQRLRGFSLSESRQDPTITFISHNEVAVRDDLNELVSNGTDTENEGEWLESSSVSTTSLTGSPENMQNSSRNKPPCIGWNALCNQHKELFTDVAPDKAVKGSSDCSICLEKFSKREELIHLSCGHRFHPDCLEPWVKISVDCPYCRARINC